MREKIRIFKRIPSIDAEIRTVEMPDDKNPSQNPHYRVEVGLHESIGEQGDILTLYFDEKPTEKQIIEETKENLKETLKEYQARKNPVSFPLNPLTGREEMQLKAMRKHKGWRHDYVRHSNAKRFGHAGGNYARKRKTTDFMKMKKGKRIQITTIDNQKVRGKFFSVVNVFCEGKRKPEPILGIETRKGIYRVALRNIKR